MGDPQKSTQEEGLFNESSKQGSTSRENKNSIDIIKGTYTA
jgi:hypothetical protein